MMVYQCLEHLNTTNVCKSPSVQVNDEVASIAFIY